MGKREEFLSIVNSKVGQGYVWGGQNDDKLTKAKLDASVRSLGRKHY